ncbi:MAG: DUF1016 N-terminal domain-containing protein [Clostridiales bacterium]|nr:DUF1016 N-terminal domain-containing protein [Clostridiales bacterium]
MAEEIRKFLPRKAPWRYRSCQIKAAVRVNEEMLKFYWSLGRDVEKAKSSYDWGSHFYSQISKDLKKLLPDAKSFSPRNLLYMNQFYRLFSDEIIAKQLVSQLEEKENEIKKQAVSQYEQIFRIPWGHMIQIINKCSDNQQLPICRGKVHHLRPVWKRMSERVLCDGLAGSLFIGNDACRRR